MQNTALLLHLIGITLQFTVLLV